ncbi:MAG: HAD-superfamily hydrolase, subfamily IA, variant 3 [Candidatus Beckwithbacteria bacterium GW2011_GWB1_47_15]|uniref:HAD-superfamily hydrolase, subfamily IA, variant 3 n=1 Tax=Candidatus Beckwithbacteria bacterium GW2011_GWB1_47_15 TaxID=1618371 RepID=A0A0G1UVC9_9BACT|nr:MAG: haloacid dehalogenase superfamily protein, subfamily IA, variant 3 with third motif having DD or ED [Candidatus Beckwithbacteria bacterium GW2011_GWC1_49_16]KKU35596.1 MAG: HAD-superfamily hydrolase, subfamily IA, variant 3 [Candidatus Beckwithbacteria bacterium GW2011_GWA1_46_30]KKU61650.1 MAG: HAD-superfamily hydrolase, subfamily IA, variant 3 [Candidatus Beckwithbacteria bacterium GW2011_GWB1_47_15]KKU72153.1 MAG: HAD-superfamily hydrolase, subfamily IA, variant 3 [Candidatus Beckwith
MKLNDFQAVIFDMDGVIVDSEDVWYRHRGQLYKKMGVDYTKVKDEDVVGRSMDGIYQQLTDKYGLKVSKEKFLQLYHQTANQVYQEEVALLPAVLDLIKQIALSGLKMTVASSSPPSWIKMVLTRFDLKKFFPLVVSAEDVAGRGKPAPDIYLYTARKLKVKPQDCLVIEDSINGVKSAHKAGMTVIWYNPGTYPNDAVPADKIVSSHREIIKLLAL